MFNGFVGSFASTIKFLSIVSASKINLALALMLWHQAAYCNCPYRFFHLARMLSFLAWELRVRLNFRYWVKWLWQLAFHTNGRSLLPSVPGTDFLRLRDGQTIFDFFKTLSFSGISPPAIA